MFADNPNIEMCMTLHVYGKHWIIILLSNIGTSKNTQVCVEHNSHGGTSCVVCIGLTDLLLMVCYLVGLANISFAIDQNQADVLWKPGEKEYNSWRNWIWPGNGKEEWRRAESTGICKKYVKVAVIDFFSTKLTMPVHGSYFAYHVPVRS